MRQKKLKMQKLNKLLLLVSVVFLFSCENGTQEINAILPDNHASVENANKGKKAKSDSSSRRIAIDGIWILTQKFDAKNNKVNFKNGTILEIKNPKVTKRIDQIVVFEDTLILLHNLNNQRYEYVLKNNEKYGLYYNTLAEDKLQLSIYKFDGGYELYFRK